MTTASNTSLSAIICDKTQFNELGGTIGETRPGFTRGTTGRTFQGRDARFYRTRATTHETLTKCEEKVLLYGNSVAGIWTNVLVSEGKAENKAFVY